jgi:hypothetical protein
MVSRYMWEKLDDRLCRKMGMESNLEMQVVLYIKYASDDRRRCTSQYQPCSTPSTVYHNASNTRSGRVYLWKREHVQMT